MSTNIFDFGEMLNLLDGEDFEERPVTIEQFVQGTSYLGLPPLSENQYTMIKASSQIYKRDTLHNLFGVEEGEKRWKQTCTEVIMQLGKGSGKDYSSTIACSYIVYLLLCLKDPARYYGKPPGDSIDILNIAINSAQANNVFFKGFQRRVDLSPWFQGKYETKAGHISFIKNVNVYSGHSEREAWEGYNCRTPDVEALTKSGWKTYDQLSIGEEIYTINHETGAGQWNPIERINVFNTVDEDIVEYSGSSFNATSTMDHRWPVINRAGERSWKTTATLTASDNIPLIAKSNGQPVEKTYSDDLVRLAASYMTEGSDQLASETVPSYEFLNALTSEQLDSSSRPAFLPIVEGRMSLLKELGNERNLCLRLYSIWKVCFN